MSKIRFTSAFAIFSIIITLIHFIFETLYTLKYGQTWIDLLPDYLVITLLCVGGFFTVKNTKLVGILCGAWGFTLYLHYITWSWRYHEFLNGTSTDIVENTMDVLLYTIPVSIIAFVISIIICFTDHKKYGNNIDRIIF